MEKSHLRKIKVYESSGYGRNTVPQIRLQGKWLEECGFDIGEQVSVECGNGKIVIVRQR